MPGGASGRGLAVSRILFTVICVNGIHGPAGLDERFLTRNGHTARQVAALLLGQGTDGAGARLPRVRDLAERLASSAGLRNRLVHRCDILDDGRVLASSAMTGGPFRSAARACRG